MPKLVVINSMLQCSYGLMPMPLGVAGTSAQTQVGLLASVMDFQPANIKPFGTCKSPSNPVMSSTGAPGPCTPQVAAKWSPGSSKVTIKKAGASAAALTADSKCTCALYGGSISIMPPGSTIDAK